jgi:hypothetical protein
VAASVQLRTNPSDGYVFRPKSRAVSNGPATRPGPSPRKEAGRGEYPIFDDARNEVATMTASPNLWSDVWQLRFFEGWRRPHNLPSVRLQRTMRSLHDILPTKLDFGGNPWKEPQF